MPDEDLVGEDFEAVDTPEEEVETPEDAPLTALEQRIVALELTQRSAVNEIRTAVGRVQSLSAKLDKTNDPQIEARLRTELAGVTELLGLVTESIDESILPRDVKQRVSSAQATLRSAAADAEINRRIAEAVAGTPTAVQSEIDTSAIEAAAVNQIRGLGLNDTDPAFDWAHAALLLHTQGQSAMWGYLSQVESALLADGTPAGGPQRRPRATAPRPASAVNTTSDLARFLDKGAPLEEKLAQLRAQGIFN